MTAVGAEDELADRDAGRVATRIVATHLPLFEAGSAHMSPWIAAGVAAVILVPWLFQGEWEAFFGGAAVFALIGGVLSFFYWNAHRSLLHRRPGQATGWFTRHGRETPPRVTHIATDERLRDLVLTAERRSQFLTYDGRSKWDWPAFLAELHRRSIVRPHTIVDEATLPQLGAIPLTENLLEPEPVQASGDRSRSSLLLGAGACALGAAYFFMMGIWVVGVLLSGLALLMTAGLPQVRDVLRTLPMMESGVLAAPGVVVDAKRKRRWTIDDAVMLVQCTSTVGPLIVRIVGEAGWVTLTFSDERDADFVTLWQRWNHPRPRPDLLPGE
jgi:hypothetical protein